MARKTKARVFYLIFFLFACTDIVKAQTNIGTEFWTGYMDHINGNSGVNGSQMILYIASDVTTTGTVAIADGSFIRNFTVNPNVITKFTIPSSAFLANTNGIVNKGIHITSSNPIAVYAHIFANNVSGATLLLPVNTLTNDYYSLNFTQKSNTGPAYSTFMIVAPEDNTLITITPTAALIDGSVANRPFTITLNKGQIYQGLSNTDLTGTHIVSIGNSGTNCKKIAVFSGSSKILIGTPNITSDNLFQQVYPTASWGRSYITIPLKTRNYDVFRVVLSDPSSNLVINGKAIDPSQFVNNFYYEFTSQSVNTVSCDKPIQVVQYAVSQGNNIDGSFNIKDIGDPEMIFLTPLEQTVDRVTLYSANEYLITNSFINVVIPSGAVGSFKVDGVNTGLKFSVVSGSTGYSYAQINVATGATHNIVADQGFNAIAYGFGNQESYGYAAGTNIRNINEYIQFYNGATKQAVTSGCAGVPLIPEVVVPYQTSTITWDLGNGNAPLTQVGPPFKNTILKNGQTLYVYDYPSSITYQAGIYGIKIAVLSPISTQCGANEEIDDSFHVFDSPVTLFAARDSVCSNDTLGFYDVSHNAGINIQSWKWDFGNGDTSAVQNPVYTFLVPGNYTVKLTISSTSGCTSSYTKKVHVRSLPLADFKYSIPPCQNQSALFSDKSVFSENKIVQWIWDYGDGSRPEVKTDNLPFIHIFPKAGNYTVKLQVTDGKGCSAGLVTKIITVQSSFVASFELPDVCLANTFVQFKDRSTISDSSSTLFTYLWNFDDLNSTAANSNTSSVKNPLHQFIKPGIYHINLITTYNNSCSISVTKDFMVSGQAAFSSAASACPADSISFNDTSDSSNKVINSWNWDFGDGNSSSLQNPKHAFKLPGDYQVTLTLTGHNGCSSTSSLKTIHISRKPTARIIYTQPTCEKNNVVFGDASIAVEGIINIWKWDFGDGLSSSVQNPTHTYAVPGLYTIKLIVMTNLGCIDSAGVTFKVGPLPVASFAIPDVCVNDGQAVFSATPDNRAKSYNWEFGDGSSTTVARASGMTVVNPVSHSGLYYAKLTVVTADGCTSDTTQQYFVNGSYPLADFDLPNSSVCSTNAVLIRNKSVLTGFNNGDITSLDVYYDLVNDPATKVHYERPSPGQVFTHQYPLEHTASKRYTIRMIAFSGQTCYSAPKELSVTLLPVPLSTFSSLPDVCQSAGNVDLFQYISKLGTDVTYSFYLDTEIKPLKNNLFNSLMASLGQHIIKCVVTNNFTGSCADTLTQSINVLATPVVTAGNDIELIPGESTILQGSIKNFPSGNVKIQWQPTTGLSNPNILTPKASPKGDTKYVLTATSITGGISCPASDSVEVKILHAPLPPNTFTPNGDGINDTWSIKYLDKYLDCIVQVFNRNGNLVFSSIGYNTPWNGRYQGQDLPVGTYYYIINPKHNLKILSGSVTIIR
ncbi:MAG: PKD domain-containing protein [Mucilaginibacter sp.]|uniref:PKD domain-containing protein n=1 Tax=Mucilaginibacter sp. TaxID=1882438 RepID=UPI003262F3F9